MKIDKKKLIEKFCEQLFDTLALAQNAAAGSREAATNEESKPENQYDTRALEASYLAGAQAHRVKELESQAMFFRAVEIQSYDSKTPIGPTALVQLESDGQATCVLIMAHGGGLSVQYDGLTIQVLTPASPLGEALVGLLQGDTAIVESPKQTREYDITLVQ